MTTQARTTPPTPTPETVDLWSRQMIEMQKMLLQNVMLTDQDTTPPKVEDADEDMWDNMPV